MNQTFNIAARLDRFYVVNKPIINYNKSASIISMTVIKYLIRVRNELRCLIQDCQYFRPYLSYIAKEANNAVLVEWAVGGGDLWGAKKRIRILTVPYEELEAYDISCLYCYKLVL